jgi:ATP-dependent DNA helicase Q1
VVFFVFLVVSIQPFFFGKETEYLLVDMLLQKYLQESYHQTAYQTLVYLVRGPLAPKLTRLTRETLEVTKEVNRLVVECTFRKRAARGRGGLKAASSSQDQQDGDGVAGKLKKPPGRKRKRNAAPVSEDEEGVVGLSDDEIEEVDIERPRLPLPVSTQSQGRSWILNTNEEEDSDFFDDGDGWSHSMRSMAKRSSSPTRKKQRISQGWDSAGGFMGRVITENDKEVMVLSD